jgi:hypothetical protein
MKKGPSADEPLYHRAFSTNSLIMPKNAVKDLALAQLRLILWTDGTSYGPAASCDILSSNRH